MPLQITPRLNDDLPQYKDAVREEIERQEPITLAQLKRNLEIPTPNVFDPSEERFRRVRRLHRLNRALRSMVEEGELERISWGTYARINKRGTTR